MSDNTHIQCKICGQDVHAIKLHLRDVHGEDSSKPCTLEQYKTDYPEAPLFSEVAKEKIRSRKEQLEKKAAVKEIVIEGDMMPMAELFGLGRIKAAKTKSGQDIMVAIDSRTVEEDLIPDRDSNYVFDINNLKAVLMGIATNIPLYVYGHAGVGKSTLFEQVCACTRRRMLRVQHCADTESSQIVGQWTVKKHKDETTGQIVSVTEWEPGPLQVAMINGYVYLADEYDRGHPGVMSVYQAVLEGKSLYTKEAPAEFRNIKPHENFRICATGNSNGSGDDTGLYQATIMQDAATLERFGIVIQQTYMPRKQELAVVKGQSGVNDEDAAKIIEFAQKIRNMYPAEISLTLGPRVAINIARIGLMRADFVSGVELSFANRLAELEREAVLQVAQRIWG